MKCSNCGSENVKHVPAGIRKADGKPYKAFSICEDCKAYQNNNNPAPKQKQDIPSPPSRTEGILEDIRELLTEIRDNQIEKPTI